MVIDGNADQPGVQFDGTLAYDASDANAGKAPAVVRNTHSVDEWLTLIAAGQAVGMTSEATASLNPRPGVAYRAVVDAPPIAVWLAWWKDQPPQHLTDLITLACDAYRV